MTDTWLSVAEGATVPGGPVSGVVVDDRLSLFLADPRGGVVSAAGRPDGWGGWGPVSDGATVPGGRVSAVRDEGGLISVFLADPDGDVLTCRGLGTGWTDWSSVAQGWSTPGGHVTAYVGADGVVNLFLADPGGGVLTCRGLGTGWTPWASVARGVSAPGGVVSAFSAQTLAAEHLGVVLADLGGAVHLTTGLADTWELWRPVAEGVTRPGAPITAVRLRGRVHATVPLSRDPTVTVLVMADARGGVRATQISL